MSQVQCNYRMVDKETERRGDHRFLSKDLISLEMLLLLLLSGTLLDELHFE